MLFAVLAACAVAVAQDSTLAPAQPMVPPTASAPVGEVPPPQEKLPAPVNPISASAPAQPELTLDECIARALKKNFDLEIARYNPAIAEDAIQVAKAGLDPTLTLTSTRTFSQQAASLSELDGSPSPTSDNTNTRLAVSEKIATGATVGLSTQLNRAANNSSFNTLNPAFNSAATVSVSQPLLRGFGMEVTKASIRRAEIGLKRANLDFKTQAVTVIESVENAYYNLTFAREQLAVFRASLELANKLYSEAQTRRDTGVATDLDVLSAQVGVANARGNVIQAEQADKDRQDALLALVGQGDLDEKVGTVRFPAVESAAPVFVSSYQLALQNQPAYLSAAAAIEQYRIDLKLAKNARLPSLAVGGAYGLAGRKGSAGAAYDQLPNHDGYNWEVDLSLSVPIGFRGDKAVYRQTLATLNREEARLRQLEQNIQVQVRSAVRAVEANMEGVSIAQLAAELSQKQYELEKARFDAGLSTSYRVLQAQTDLDNAQVKELQARVTLNSAISALHRIEGSSLHRYHVDLH